MFVNKTHDHQAKSCWDISLQRLWHWRKSQGITKVTGTSVTNTTKISCCCSFTQNKRNVGANMILSICMFSTAAVKEDLKRWIIYKAHFMWLESLICLKWSLVKHTQCIKNNSNKLETSNKGFNESTFLQNYDTVLTPQGSIFMLLCLFVICVSVRYVCDLDGQIIFWYGLTVVWSNE